MIRCRRGTTCQDAVPPYPRDHAAAPVAEASGLTAARWGRDLLKIVGDPPVDWLALSITAAWLVGIAAVALGIAYVGLIHRGGGLRSLLRPPLPPLLLRGSSLRAATINHARDRPRTSS